MNTLVINSGSSSIKFQLLDMTTETVLASGLVERIGEARGKIRCVMHPETAAERFLEYDRPIADHRSGMLMAGSLLSDKEDGVVKSREEIGLIGHRVVHGGEKFHQPTLISDEVVAAISENVPLAPLHNPANLDGISVARELFPGNPAGRRLRYRLSPVHTGAGLYLCAAL
jgi:acetate kinase